MAVKKVILRRAEYDYDKLRPLIFELLDDLVGDKIGNKSRVLIKPNLLAPAPPEKAMLTHPMIVRASVEYVLEEGWRAPYIRQPCDGEFRQGPEGKRNKRGPQRP